MAREKTYFVSDLHLGSDLLEPPQVTERRFVRWLDTIRDDAKAVYLLGDIFDFWFEYRKTVPRGFTRFLGKIAEMHDAGVEVCFFTGNHDIWMFDYFQQELGVRVYTRPLRAVIDGRIFYLAHGDGLGDRSRSFGLIRFLFHSRFCQCLFAALPSRWGISFGQWWSRSSRKRGIAHPVGYLGEDREHLVVYAKQYVREHPDTDYLIFGHRHILLDQMLNRKSRMLIIGDWMEYFSYAVFDGNELKLEQYKAN
jgi:UDP-2,3-diacylglucosamine hydrolase